MSIENVTPFQSEEELEVIAMGEGTEETDFNEDEAGEEEEMDAEEETEEATEDEAGETDAE